MTNTKSNDNLRSVGLLVIALLLGAVFLLPPVKAWLNGHPVTWRVLYPALLAFAVYGLVLNLREHRPARDWLPWVVILLAALSATLWAFGAGVIFHTIGYYAGIAFVLLEVVLTVLDMAKPEPA